MKMKKFKDFINEDIRNLLTGKSDDEIKSVIDKMNILDRYREAITNKNFPLKYIPTQQEMEDNIEEIEERVKDYHQSYEDLFGGIEDTEFDYIIKDINKLRTKSKDSTISSLEITLLETIIKTFNDIENKDEEVNSYNSINSIPPIPDDYNIRFDHKRYYFIENMIKMVGGQKIVDLLKKRRNNK